MISNDKKVMAKIARRLGSCPYCGGNNFILPLACLVKKSSRS